MNAAAGGSLFDQAAGMARFEPSSSEALRLIAFTLGNEWYALEGSGVRGIEPEATLTAVPQSPEWLVGVFNLHGNILPAIDPRPLLGLPKSDSNGNGLMIVFLFEGNQAALRVDSVDEIYELPSASLEPPLPATEGARADMILGQVRVRDRLIGVINLPNLVHTILEG
jgi:purine-binding chemotaxis protein CheW